MVAQHYRWDFIGLSTDTKPTPATSEKVVDGSTFYCSDNSKLYVFCKDTWYEKTATGGGGGVTVVQTTGTSTTDVMSQKAVTDALASAGGVTVLTSADYNYPENEPAFIALWLLPVWQYVLESNTGFITSSSSSSSQSGNDVGVLILTQANSSNHTYSTFIVSDNFKNEYYKVQSNGMLRTGFPHEI